VGAIAFAAKYVPETKDKSLEDLEHYFKNAAAEKTAVKDPADVK
jgi:major inositol transporter-like SP family MFS transporter